MGNPTWISAPVTLSQSGPAKNTRWNIVHIQVNFLPKAKMKLCGLLCLVLTISGASFVNSLERDDRQVGEIVIPIVTKVASDIAKMLLHKLLENWLDTTNVDVVYIGRGFRIHKDGGSQVTVTDRASGTHVTIKEKTLQASVNTACNNLIKTLLIKGIMSVDDLHLPPTLAPSTRAPCVDHNGRAYCKPMVAKGLCGKTSAFNTFMEDNCRKSCGLC